jgi:hypothetical protein
MIEVFYLSGILLFVKSFQQDIKIKSFKISNNSAKFFQFDFPGGKDGRCVGLTTLPPSCADCLEILEP